MGNPWVTTIPAASVNHLLSFKMAVVSVTDRSRISFSFFFLFLIHTESLAADGNQIYISHNLGISVRAADLPNAFKDKTRYIFGSKRENV